jgi:hypothetical protein
MFEKVEHALTELKGDAPKGGFSPIKKWIKSFAFISISLSILFLAVKIGIETIFDKSTYLSIVNIDAIILLQIIIISFLIEMRLHQASIRSRL